jgi:methionyl-tRNA formyltransferase
MVKLIFCGTPQFAVPTLEKLIAEKHEIDLVMTNPDEPSGRGYDMKATPVKLAALKAGLRVFQPLKLKEDSTVGVLSKFHPDFIVVVAYGHIIPKWMIDLPRYGCINLHASLLPKYRGAAPIQWALIRGESVTGVTTMKIDEGLDTGDVLLQKEIPIHDDDTMETLAERLSGAGADLMVETLSKLDRAEIQPQPQNHAQATFAPILKKQDGRIDWRLKAEEIWQRVRGLRPWPGAYTTFRSKNLHIWSAAPSAGQAGPADEPGTLLVERGGLRVVCGRGTLLEVHELQVEGRKRLGARDFLNGVRIAANEKLVS